MKTQLLIAVCSLSAFFFASCKKELKTGKDSSDNLIAANPNAKVASALVTAGPFTDWSGQVSVVLVSSDFGPSNDLLQGSVTVPDDYVVVGGGAYNYQGEPGSFLTASYPSSDLTTWNIVSKGRPGVSTYYLACYAIGLKIGGLTSTQLRNYISLTTATSGVASQPTISASLAGSGYTLIGGGAKVNWSGAGNFLTDSHPDVTNNAWAVASKDHITSSPASITSYAIGIMQNIPNFGSLDIGTDLATLTPNCMSSLNQGSIAVTIPQGWVLTSPGGTAKWNQYGRMIIGMYPTINFSNSKANLYTGSSQQWDCGQSIVYAMRMEKTH
jgi:vibriolysin